MCCHDRYEPRVVGKTTRPSVYIERKQSVVLEKEKRYLRLLLLLDYIADARKYEPCYGDTALCMLSRSVTSVCKPCRTYVKKAYISAAHLGPSHPAGQLLKCRVF